MQWWDVVVCWLRSFWDESDERLYIYRSEGLVVEIDRLRAAISDLEYSISVATLYGIAIPSGTMRELTSARELLVGYEVELTRCNHAVVV